MTKLTREQRLEVALALRETERGRAKYPLREIAARFGIGVSRLSAIRRDEGVKLRGYPRGRSARRAGEQR